LRAWDTVRSWFVRIRFNIRGNQRVDGLSDRFGEYKIARPRIENDALSRLECAGSLAISGDLGRSQFPEGTCTGDGDEGGCPSELGGVYTSQGQFSVPNRVRSEEEAEEGRKALIDETLEIGSSFESETHYTIERVRVKSWCLLCDQEKLDLARTQSAN